MARNYTTANALIDAVRAAPMTIYGTGLSYMTLQTMDGMPDAGKLTAGAFMAVTAAAGLYSSVKQFKHLRQEQQTTSEKTQAAATELAAIGAAGLAGAAIGYRVGGAETAALIGVAAASIPAALTVMPALNNGKTLEQRI